MRDKDVGDVVRVVEHAADGAEEEHQAVADEEGDGRRADGDLAVFRETDEVGRAGAAGDEGADGQGDGRAECQGIVAGGGEILQRVPCVRIVAEDFQGGETAADGDGGNGDERDDGQRLDAEIGGCREQDAGDDHGNPDVAFNAFFLQIRHNRERAHRDADAEPANLRDRQNGGRQRGTALSEGAAGQKMDGQTCGRRHVRQRRRVGPQNQIAQQNRQKEFRHGQAVAQRRARPHGRREKRESKHDHEHGPKATPLFLRHVRLRIIMIFRHCPFPFFFVLVGATQKKVPSGKRDL